MAELDWFVEVNEKLKNMVDASTEKSVWKKRSIYKVPSCVTDLNEKAYKPQAVSFGPYHHDDSHLMSMEEHKERALLRFLKRSGKPLELFFNSLSEVVQDLKDTYDPLDLAWQNDTQRFLQLMILDGCFMLEIMRTETSSFDDYVANDPIFSDHGKLFIMPYIRRDMLMLENQLPMLVLEKLVAMETDNTKHEDYINKLIIKFCSLGMPIPCLDRCLHVLDVYRKNLLQEQPGKPKRSRTFVLEGDGNIIGSATELNEAGIRFERSKSLSLKDVMFRSGVLRLPLVVVDDATESMYLNLMAFEGLHVGAGSEVTSFIFLMDNLIDNERDVALLNTRGIIQNAMGSDKAVAKLFNSLSKDITLDPESSLNVVHKEVNMYCKKPWNEWRANLIHTYFRNPWAILSLVAAVFLFALTIVQTFYTIYPYYHPNESPPPTAPPLPPRVPSHRPNPLHPHHH